MATQDSIDKIINIRFNYKELVQGWVKANEAIEDNKKILADLKKEYETGQISLSDYKKAQLELKSTTKALTDEQRQYEKEIQNNIKVEKELDGSAASAIIQQHRDHCKCCGSKVCPVVDINDVFGIAPEQQHSCLKRF